MLFLVTVNDGPDLFGVGVTGRGMNLCRDAFDFITKTREDDGFEGFILYGVDDGKIGSSEYHFCYI